MGLPLIDYIDYVEAKSWQFPYEIDWQSQSKLNFSKNQLTLIDQNRVTTKSNLLISLNNACEPNLQAKILRF